MAFDLADLLTAAGQAMGGANRRLAGTGAPALLREFDFEFSFDAGVEVPEGAPTLLLTGTAKRMLRAGTAVKVTATYIAAPSLVPIPVPGGGVDP